MKISVDDKADRDALAAILARERRRGYKKTAKSNAYYWWVEYKEASKDESLDAN